MASLSGQFAANGVSAGVTGLSGPSDLSVKISGGDSAQIYLQVSYDAGVSYSDMEDGKLGNRDVDRILVAGDAATYYRFRCTGLSTGGTADFYLGQS